MQAANYVPPPKLPTLTFMTRKTPRPHLSRRPIALLILLLFTLSANAQQEYHEVSLTLADHDGKRVWLHEGKPLQGPCKINYLSDDFRFRYTLSNFRDGVQGDSVSYYAAKSNTLLRTVIRLAHNARHICDYNLYNGAFKREWTEVDGQRDGILKEWYAEGKPRLEEEYKAGKLDGLSRAWDESGRLVSEQHHHDGELDGEARTWHYEGSDWGEIEIAYHRQNDHPYMIERFAFADGQQGLIERTVPDSDGATLYAARKSDCDSTRIDTLYGARMTVEIRDFREGRIRSLERYDASSYYSGTLVPHGVFELYAPDGRIGTRMLYEEGELIVSRDYDEEEEARPDVTTTLLSREEGERLLTAASDSNYLKDCDESRPLRIRNQAGEVLFECDDEERRYEYYGYDPELHLHLGFSSIGDWNDLYWYVVHENGEMLTLQEELLAIHGKTGLIASGKSYFEGELDLSIFRYMEYEEEGSFFEPIFCFTLTDVPAPVWDFHWIGDSSLLLVMENGCIRLDIAPDSLTEPVE